MNEIVITDRKFLCQHRNGADFLTNPTTDFVTYLQGNAIEKLKLIQTVEVGTIVSATSLNQITAETVGSQIRVTHPFNTWANEGFVVGNTVRIEEINSGNFTNETVEILNGGFMFLSDTSFFSTLGTTDGDALSTYIFKVTTVPTSLIYDYGFSPNGSINQNFNSQLTGEIQSYAANGVSGSFSSLPYLGTSQSDLADIQAKFDGTGADLYTHTFTIEIEFQMVHYIAAWLINYNNKTLPPEFQGPNSIRYISKMNFGVNINNPNDGKVFIDDFQGGSVGLFNQNFNAGSTNYTLDEITYLAAGFDSNSIDSDVLTAVEIKIKKNNGSWAAGETVYLYHSKLPSELEYAQSGGTFEENFVFKGVRTTEGAAQITDGFIQDYEANIDGGDPTILVINFETSYSAAELLKIANGTPYFLGVGVSDSGGFSATDSDRTIVHCDSNKWIRTSDISGLVTANQIDFYNSTQDPALDTPSSNINSWINSIHFMRGEFKLQKDPSDGEGINTNARLKNLKIQLVALLDFTGTFFTIQEYNFAVPSGAQINVDGTMFQGVGQNDQNTLGVPPADQFNRAILTSEVPGSYQATQQWNWEVGMEISWRQWVELFSVQDVAPEFYNTAQPFNNFNTRASNYDGINNYNIHVFASAEVEYNGVLTVYHMKSDPCDIADFDVDVVPGWTATTKLYDENNDETDDIYLGQDIRIEVTMDNPGIALPLATTGGQIVCEISNSQGRDYRLHTSKNWDEQDNFLKPLVGETNVKMTQLLAPNKIVLECLLKKEKIQPGVSLNFYGHLDQSV